MTSRSCIGRWSPSATLTSQTRRTRAARIEPFAAPPPVLASTSTVAPHLRQRILATFPWILSSAIVYFGLAGLAGDLHGFLALWTAACGVRRARNAARWSLTGSSARKAPFDPVSQSLGVKEWAMSRPTLPSLGRLVKFDIARGTRLPKYGWRPGKFVRLGRQSLRGVALGVGPRSSRHRRAWRPSSSRRSGAWRRLRSRSARPRCGAAKSVRRGRAGDTRTTFWSYTRKSTQIRAWYFLSSSEATATELASSMLMSSSERLMAITASRQGIARHIDVLVVSRSARLPESSSGGSSRGGGRGERGALQADEQPEPQKRARWPGGPSRGRASTSYRRQH